MKTGRVLIAMVAVPVALVLALPAVAIASLLFLAAGLTTLLARWFEPKYSLWNAVIQFDTELGWKPRPNLDVRYFARGDDIHRVQTDPEGWPGHERLEECAVVAVGDSFVFGYGTDTDKTFTRLDPRLRVKAIGCPGYSMVQGVMLMRQFGERLRGKRVLWFICVENDLYDNLMPNKPNFYTTPFVRRGNGRGDWEIVNGHVSQKRWRGSVDNRPYYPMLARLCTQGPLSNRAFSACEYLTLEAKRICDRAGATLVVVTIPNKYQLSPSGAEFLRSHLAGQNNFSASYPDERIAEICQAAAVPFVAAAGYLTANDYKAHDTHWNARGHRRMVQLLRDVCEQPVAERGPATSSERPVMSR